MGRTVGHSDARMRDCSVTTGPGLHTRLIYPVLWFGVQASELVSVVRMAQEA